MKKKKKFRFLIQLLLLYEYFDVFLAENIRNQNDNKF